MVLASVLLLFSCTEKARFTVSLLLNFFLCSEKKLFSKLFFAYHPVLIPRKRQRQHQRQKPAIMRNGISTITNNHFQTAAKYSITGGTEFHFARV